jgi:hypothetical protein
MLRSSVRVVTESSASSTRRRTGRGAVVWIAGRTVMGGPSDDRAACRILAGFSTSAT